MPGKLESRVIIVTGATSGIGRVTAMELASEGARLVLAGRRAAEGAGLVREIQARGGQALFVEADVRDAAAVEGMVQAAVSKYGRLDCAFNNAGIGGENLPLAAHTQAGWADVLDTNLTGTWLCMKHEITQMLTGGGGVIVNNASIFGLVGADYGIAPYIASKHGVVGLTRAAAVEYGRQGIRVNAICPGIVQTEMVERSPEPQRKAIDAEIQKNVPLGRLAQPQEIARAVVWLCSDDASFITGQALGADGGWLAR